MINALKFILQENNITQYKFAEDVGVHRQSVTRWVKRQKPMHEDYIDYVEKHFEVKRKYFVDERRYVKMLDENEKLELEDYLLRRKFQLPTSTASKYKYYKNISNLSETELAQREERREKYTVAYRRKRANADIHRVITEIKKDINSSSSILNECSTLSSLDILENNIQYYQNYVSLRENKKIPDGTWNSINAALYMFVSDDTDIEIDELATRLYKVFKEYRT